MKKSIETAEITSFFNVTTDGDIADSLGEVRAQIAALKAQQDFLEELLKAKHVTEANGEKFRVKIAYDATRKTTAWKKIAEKMGASRQMITANTSQSVFDRVTVTAHKKA